MREAHNTFEKQAQHKTQYTNAEGVTIHYLTEMPYTNFKYLWNYIKQHVLAYKLRA